MLAIKCEGMHEMPKYCDDCIYYATRPHPYKGWSDECQLGMHTMNEDDEDWTYDGNGRPKMCPLIEIKEKKIVD